MTTRLRTALWMLLISMILLWPSLVLANSAPPRWSGDKTGVLMPGSSGQIHVLKETLHFEVSDTLAKAKVTATYEMENRGPAVSTPVVFVHQGQGSDVAVSWNGRTLGTAPVEMSTAAHAAARDAWNAMKVVVDPAGGEAYTTDFFGEREDQLGFVQFTMAMAAGENGQLVVTYNHTAAWERGRHANRIFHYQYLLSPAKGWASFGPLELQVVGPGPKQAFFGSTIPMTYADGAYRATLPGLPDQDLAFSFMSRAGLWGDIVDPGTYYFVAFLLTLVAAALLGLGLGWLAGFLRSGGWAVTVAVVTGLLVGGVTDFLLSFAIMGLIPALSGEGYGVAIMAVGFCLIAVPLTTVVAGITAKRRSRRRAPAA